MASIFFVITLLAVIFFPGQYSLYYLSAGLLINASASVLINLSPPMIKRVGVCVLAAGLGLITGYFRMLPQNRVTSILSVNKTNLLCTPIETVDGFSGFMLEDSISSERCVIYRIMITKVWNEDITAETYCRAKVLSMDSYAESPKLFWGQRVIVKSSINQYTARVHPDQIHSSGFISSLYKLRSVLRLNIDKIIKNLDIPASALLSALLFGDRDDLDRDLYIHFRESGCLHILALSGLHIGIIYLIVFSLFFFIPGRNTRVILSIIFVLAYLFLAGPKTSLLRAVIMLCTGSICLLLNRDVRSLNLLALSASVILFVNPCSAYSLSFQLSFLAVFGILLIGPVVYRYIVRFIPPIISRPLSYSFGAQLLITPLLFNKFGIVYPIGILMSIIVIPLVFLFIWTGLAYIFFLPLKGLLPLILNSLYNLIEKPIILASRVPGVRIDWKPYFWIPFILLLFLLRIRCRGDKSEL